jgi:hypothetical protein
VDGLDKKNSFESTFTIKAWKAEKANEREFFNLW